MGPNRTFNQIERVYTGTAVTLQAVIHSNDQQGEAKLHPSLIKNLTANTKDKTRKKTPLKYSKLWFTAKINTFIR